MKITHKISIVTVAVSLLSLSVPLAALAATSPSVGGAGIFTILSSTFTRNVGVTTITGSLGYTTLGGSGSHTVTGGTTHVADSVYNQAGIDQATALAALNSQGCTTTFPDGAIDLAATSSNGQALGVYTPGVYCTTATSAASIGTAGITLSGAGTYIFRINGALTTVDDSKVTLSGASACDVFWTPTAETTLGANTTFAGTDIDASGITVGSVTTWIGRALAFGGTVTAATDTFSNTCSIQPASQTGQKYGNITVVKTVINDNGGTKTVADFPLFVNNTLVVSGSTNSFPAPTLAYTVTETGNANYTHSFSGACDFAGHIALSPGDNKICTITNNDIGTPVPPLIDVVKVASPLSLPAGPGSVTYTYTLRNIGTVPMSNVTAIDDSCSPVSFVSGDTNNDSKLDVNETWTYRCGTTLSETHTNTVTATGWANGISAVHIASATVVVGSPTVSPFIHVVKVPSVFTLPAIGGAVTYTYTVTNPGTEPLSNVTITDDKCTGLPGRVSGHPGDLNKNNLLESNEVWKFTCKSNLTQTTTNIATASGDANGLTARDHAVATVVVASPALPNTGLSPRNKTPWDIFITAGILIVMTMVVAVLSKRTA